MNQYPYDQAPQQMPPQQMPPQQVPPQQMPPQPMQPQTPMYPAYPPKRRFFDDEMLGILGCTISGLGLCLALASTIISSSATYVYGLIMVILSMFVSGGGVVLSFIAGNRNLRKGDSRGVIPSLGLALGLIGVVLFFFLIFHSSCMACQYNKNGGVRW